MTSLSSTARAEEVADMTKATFCHAHVLVARYIKWSASTMWSSHVTVSFRFKTIQHAESVDMIEMNL